jgi:hypothetical protein
MGFSKFNRIFFEVNTTCLPIPSCHVPDENQYWFWLVMKLRFVWKPKKTRWNRNVDYISVKTRIKLYTDWYTLSTSICKYHHDGIFRFLRRKPRVLFALLVIQFMCWDRRKDARLVMLYKIDRELVAINKENRLIPTGRKTRKSHNRSFQIPSSRIDTRSGLQFSLCMMLLTLDLFLRLFATYLAALLCTVSTLFISACVYRSQTTSIFTCRQKKGR